MKPFINKKKVIYHKINACLKPEEPHHSLQKHLHLYSGRPTQMTRSCNNEIRLKQL